MSSVIMTSRPMTASTPALLTQEQLRVHNACVAVINNAPYRSDVSELIAAARALSDAYTALTQRVEAGQLAAIGACAHLQMATDSNAEWRAHEALKLLQAALPKEPR